MKRNDEQLISDYLDGDEDALGFLVNRYFKDAYFFAYKITKDRQMSEDIVQESFVKAWKNMRKFIPKGNFRNWLFTIVKNTSIDWLRKRKDLPLSIFEDENGNLLERTIVDKNILQDEMMILLEDEKYFNQLLNQINPKYREVIELKNNNDLTFFEISQFLKKPIHTIKSQYRRGLIALKRLIETKTI